MLDCFASVKASHFDVTSTTRSGEKDWFRGNVPIAELTRTLPGMLDTATRNERNVIVRPHPGNRIADRSAARAACTGMRGQREQRWQGGGSRCILMQAK